MLTFCLIVSWIIVFYNGTGLAVIDDRWILHWRGWVSGYCMDALGKSAVIALVLSGPPLLLAVLLFGFGHVFFGLAGLALSLLVLLYACGRNDYPAMMRQQPVLTDNSEIIDHLREERAYASYSRWFPAAFWFLLLGPPGALFYACVTLLACQDNGIANHATSRKDQPTADDIYPLLGWLDWLPVRLWAACYLLAGDFGKSARVLREGFFTLYPNAEFLDRVSLAAVGLDINDNVTDSQSIRNALLALNERTLWVAGIGVLLIMIIA